MGRSLQIVSFFSFVLTVWLLFHLYVGWRLWPLIHGNSGHRILLLVLALGFVLYPAGRILGHNGWTTLGWLLEYLGAVWMGSLMLLVPALAVIDTVTLFGLVLKAWVIPLRFGALAVALVLAGLAWLGGVVAPRTVDIEVEMANLPAAADGLVVVQLSDLHLGSLIGFRRLASVISRIEGMRPDVVVITGDLIDSDAESVEPLVPLMGRLTAPLGVYSILGNHDIYAGAEGSIGFMRRAGFHVLDGSAAEINPGLWVAGIPDGARGWGAEGPLQLFERAMSQVEPDAAVIYLQHAPGNEQAIAAAGVGLMLDGHTHGAQIWPAHYLVQRVFPHLSGVRRVGNMTQVVCRGAGQWGPPMRLFAPSEIYRITLRSPAVNH